MSRLMPKRWRGLTLAALTTAGLLVVGGLAAQTPASPSERDRLYRPYAVPPGGAAPSVFAAWPTPRGLAALPPPIPGIGVAATPDQIAGWDIDVRGDGLGLPPGRGTAKAGEEVYLQHCSACHGDFGEGAQRYPALIGGRGSLATEGARRTVGSYWPHAPGVFDYVRRAMPYAAPQSLSNDDYYAVTAYILYLNELVGEEDMMDAAALSRVQMPNRDGFVLEARLDTPDVACMSSCRGSRPVRITVDSRQFVQPGSASGFSEPQ